MFTEAGKEPVQGAAWKCNPQGESFGRERKSTGRIQIKQLILAKGKDDSLSLRLCFNSFTFLRDPSLWILYPQVSRKIPSSENSTLSSASFSYWHHVFCAQLQICYLSFHFLILFIPFHTAVRILLLGLNQISLGKVNRLNSSSQQTLLPPVSSFFFFAFCLFRAALGGTWMFPG